MNETYVTPKGVPHFEGEDWREALFLLAAEKKDVDAFKTVRYFQGFAGEFLTRLCHLPEDCSFTPVAIEEEKLIEWALKAPPMKGGEYLTPLALRQIWDALNAWVGDQEGGVHRFLEKKAPKWKQVGRVCFHLAENKTHETKPFAFLASFSTGFSSAGSLKHLPLGKALERYAREKSALIRLLTPIQSASERLPWVAKLLEAGKIYQPQVWSVSDAYQFLKSIPELEASGLSVKIPNWWLKRSRPQVAVTIGSKPGNALGASALLEFNVQLALGNESLNEQELKEMMRSEGGLVSVRGQWVEVDRDKLKQAMDHWEVLKKNHSGLSFAEGMRLLSGTPLEMDEVDSLSEARQWMTVTASQELEQTLSNLRDPGKIQLNESLKGLKATLRPYQKTGVGWLSFLSGMGLGACLADDMGLGKTIQILSLLLTQQNQVKPSLLIVPASLLGNWKKEAARFTPSLKVLLLHPSETNLSDYDENKLNAFDLVVTTYAMIVRQEWLQENEWNLAVLDESQAIKNPAAKQSKAVRKLKARARIALTGTPIENRLSDLWSLFDFINPGLLGSSKRFSNYVKGLDQRPGGYESLKKLVSPYILRRMKTDPKIISDLPEKIEMQTYCQLTKQQAAAYQQVVLQLEKSLETIEPNQRRGVVLSALLRLKQVCNHPSHYTGTGDFDMSKSGKFLRLKEICQELAERQQKVLIFTQFKEMIAPLDEFLTGIFGRGGLTLDGSTAIHKRSKLVDAFQDDDGPPFFILSLKAGGTGLTLTAASHVIHFDRWWNPAVENQATDRAFRIGQKKNVQVHKLITLGTVEEKIDAIIASKKKLANDVLSDTDEIALTELSNQEILNLVALDIDKATLE